MAKNVGDQVEFEQVGFRHKGEIKEVYGDGKYRVVSNTGYYYRVSEDQFREPEVDTPVSKPSVSTAPKTATPVQKPAPVPFEPKPLPEGAKADPALVQRILGLSCLKHQRVFLLLEAGCDKTEICTIIKCNFGEISNVRKQYTDEAKQSAARALLQ